MSVMSCSLGTWPVFSSSRIIERNRIRRLLEPFVGEHGRRYWLVGRSGPGSTSCRDGRHSRLGLGPIVVRLRQRDGRIPGFGVQVSGVLRRSLIATYR
jgi:hypothetical protein